MRLARDRALAPDAAETRARVTASRPVGLRAFTSFPQRRTVDRKAPAIGLKEEDVRAVQAYRLAGLACVAARNETESRPAGGGREPSG